MGARFLVEGDTAWRVARADELGFLVDADAYFRAFARAAVDADQWIGVLGWDIDSREDFGRAGWPYEDLPRTLAAFLDALAQRRERLHIDLLVWESAAIYALERELFPQVKLAWATHSHVRFELDGLHAAGASHHQKVAVVDDTFAFAGGIDMTGHRWDTPAHRPDEPLRTNPWGVRYKPFHDLQAGVSGEAARVLGDLVRTRWLRATGERLPPPEPRRGRVVPFPVDARDVDVGIVLTDACDGETPPVRNTERLHLRAIREAKREIYLENQYLTSTVIGDALKESLERPRGPEIVLVMPRRASGWLERTTMGVLRAHLLKELYEADRYGRLRVTYPVVDGESVFVHAKAFVVDGELAYVGSANLSDRSMGLDTECGIAVEAVDRPEIAAAIRGFRNRLLAEHTGSTPEEVQTALDETGSLMRAIDLLHRDERHLAPLTPDVEAHPPEWLERWMAERRLVDPHEPIEPEHVFARLLKASAGSDPVVPIDDETRWLSPPSEATRSSTAHVVSLSPRPSAVERRAWRRRAALRAALFLSVVLVALGVWAFSPLGEVIRPNELAAWLAEWRTSPLALLVVLALFVLAAIFMVPLNPVLVSTVIAFGAVRGALYGLAGALLSALVSYAIGRRAGRGTMTRLTGERLYRITRAIAQRGFLAVVAARMVPIAPFPIVNMVAGAVGIRLRHFVLGTMVGMLPGLVVTASLGETLWALLRDPRPRTIVLGIAIAALAFAGLVALRKKILPRVGLEDLSRQSAPRGRPSQETG